VEVRHPPTSLGGWRRDVWFQPWWGYKYFVVVGRAGGILRPTTPRTGNTLGGVGCAPGRRLARSPSGA
jgi:hypothetical protein